MAKFDNEVKTEMLYSDNEAKAKWLYYGNEGKRRNNVFFLTLEH